MKMMVRLSMIAAMLLLLLAGATYLMAAGPSGSSPDDGLAPTCSNQPLGPGASVWLKIPYRFDYRLQFMLDSNGAGGVTFAVYSSATASSPVGSGSYNPNVNALNWEGQLQQDGFYYVLVTNTNPFAVQYHFCVNEKQPFSLRGACAFDPLSPECSPTNPVYFEGVDVGCTGQFFWNATEGVWDCNGKWTYNGGSVPD